ncbi:MAG: hypothetical protein GYA60_01610 [Candidatus Methanofastidiosa archaeon]|nr:hypothetical protein [Candidatus Methanofastidiosa archaeon]
MVHVCLPFTINIYHTLIFAFSLPAMADNGWRIKEVVEGGFGRSAEDT